MKKRTRRSASERRAMVESWRSSGMTQPYASGVNAHTKAFHETPAPSPIVDREADASRRPASSDDGRDSLDALSATVDTPWCS